MLHWSEGIGSEPGWAGLSDRQDSRKFSWRVYWDAEGGTPLAGLLHKKEAGFPGFFYPVNPFILPIPVQNLLHSLGSLGASQHFNIFYFLPIFGVSQEIFGIPDPITYAIRQYYFSNIVDFRRLLNYNYNMTQLLNQAFKEASKLSELEQNLLAQWLLEELDSEKRWMHSFSESEDLLTELADEALAEHRLGKTKLLVADEL